MVASARPLLNLARTRHVSTCQSRTPQAGHLWLAFAHAGPRSIVGLCVLSDHVDPLVEPFFTGTRRNPVEYIGTGNYTELFADPTFWIVVKNNLLYAGVTIPVSMAIALAMALWANGKISARGFVRTAYFTPTVLPMIAAANLWLFFYTPGLGVLDQIGSTVGVK